MKPQPNKEYHYNYEWRDPAISIEQRELSLPPQVIGAAAEEIQ